MASVHDAAAYILKKMGSMPAMKLHKLLYYSQAWSLVWDEEPLFTARIEAWANGPVVPFVYSQHRGQFKVPRNWTKGNRENLGDYQWETINLVLDYYGDKPSQWLSDLTHQEDPWRLARRGVPPEERSRNEITRASMAEYYGGLGAEASEA